MRETLKVLRKSSGLFLVLSLLLSLLQYASAFALSRVFNFPFGEIPKDNFAPLILMVLSDQLLNLAASFILSLTFSFHFSSAIRTHDVSFRRWMKNHGFEAALDFSRACLQILAYTLLLVIPGLVKAARLSFLYFHMTSEPSYEKNETDPLEVSDELSKHVFWPLFGLIILHQVLSLVITLGITGAKDQSTFLQYFMLALGLGLMGLFIMRVQWHYYQLARKRGKTI